MKKESSKKKQWSIPKVSELSVLHSTHGGSAPSIIEAGRRRAARRYIES